MTIWTENRFDELVANAMAHHRAGRLGEAEAAYRIALGISPRHMAITHNLGVVLAAQGSYQSAIDHFDELIAAEPHYASAHYNRAVALQSVGQSREAIRGFGRTCSLEPGHYDAHRALGFLWLAEGERDRALDHFARTYELRRGEDRTGMVAKSLTHATRSKLFHDAEQFRFLSKRRRNGQHFEMRGRIYAEVAKDISEAVTKLSDQQLDMLGDDYNTAINICSTPSLSGRAVNQQPDREAIIRRFSERPSGVVVIDDLLTSQALVALRRHLLESTIWHDFNHISGFVASYLEDGLACPLLLQIADELRIVFPELLGKHPLTQAWAFKGLEARAAIDAHADDAAVSVNFWVTPTEANRNPDGGGLAVCRVRPPVAWKVRDYNGDKERIVAFLEQNAADTVVIPYRENRAVLFESRFFHRSDAPEFENGYENHRVNVTLLFGCHSG
jgi:Flp pilus assembly protein TadD